MFNKNSAPGLGNFKALVFYGTADGTALSADFNAGEIVGRTITIKRVSFYPYANGISTDLAITQGANTYLGKIPDQCRLNKLHDYYAGGLRPQIRINQTLLSIFPFSIGDYGLPLDYSFENINYTHLEKVINIQVSANALYFNKIDPVTTTANPKIKVVIEVVVT